jgi:hypothetical protein
LLYLPDPHPCNPDPIPCSTALEPLAIKISREELFTLQEQGN